MAVASSVHKKPMVGRLPLDDIHWEKRTISGITAYGYSKVCMRDNTGMIPRLRESFRKVKAEVVTTAGIKFTEPGDHFLTKPCTLQHESMSHDTLSLSLLLPLKERAKHGHRNGVTEAVKC